MGLVVPAATLWGLASMGLILPLLGAPAELTRTAAALLAAEFVALLGWSYGQGAVAHALAFQDIPALSLALLAATAVYGLRSRRAAAPRK